MVKIEIFKLFGSVFIDNEKANKKIDDTDKKGKGLAGTLTNAIGTAAKWGAAVGAAAIGAGAAMISLATKAGDTADRLLDLKAITGMSTDEIQRWERVTKVAGVSADTMTNASQKLTKSLDTIINSGGKGAESLQALGLSVEEIMDMNADKRMDAIARALAGIEDPTERARLGTDLLGSSWKEIAPIVDMGAEAMEKAKKSANIISEDDLNKANDFRIKVAEMKDQAGHFATMLGISVIPIAEKFFDWISQYMPQIQEFFRIALDVAAKVIQKVADVISDNVLPVLKDLWGWIEPYLPKIQDLFEESFGVAEDILASLVSIVQDLSKYFQEHWDIVEPILVGIAAGAVTFGLYTLAINAAAIATTIWSTVTGIATGVGAAFGAVLAFITSPIALVIAGIAAAAAIIWYLYKNWDEVKEKAKELWSKFTDWFLERTEKARERFNENIEKIKTFFTEGLGNMVQAGKDKLNEIYTKLAETWDNAKKKTWEIWENIKTKISDIFNNIKTTVKNKMQEVYNNTRSKLENLWAYIKSIPAKAKKWGSDILDKFWGGLKEKYDAAKKWVNDKIGSLMNKFNPWAKSSPSLIEKVRTGLGTIMDEFKNLDYMLEVKPLTARMGRSAILQSQPATAGAGVSAVAGIGPTIYNGPLVVVQNMTIRSDSDIEIISRQLHRHIQASTRARGGG